jgi:hypothetical protein
MGSKGKRKCVFCGGRVSGKGEHVWPDWLREIVPGHRPGARWRVERRVRGPHNKPRNWNFGVVPYTERVKCVCGDCNNHWMSNLETDVSAHLKPPIQNRPLRLNDGGQQLVATWVGLRAVILDRTFGGDNTIPQEVLDWLYEHRERGKRRPPNGCGVWLGAYTNPGEHAPQHRGNSLRGQLKSEELDLANPNGFDATFTVGYLVAKIVWIEPGVGNGDFQPSTSFDGRLAQIWPKRGLAVWPPPKYLSPAGVLGLADVFA